jgi:cholesterol oxidase
LDKNYLYLAEQRGLELRPDSEVVHVAALPQGGYRLRVRVGRSYWRREEQLFEASNVVFSGGALGTNSLLLRLKQDAQGLPQLSDRLGHGVRTNSESLICVTVPGSQHDHSTGIAINSILQTDDHSHLEMVRMGAGSGLFRLLTVTPHVAGGNAFFLLLRILVALVMRPIMTLRTFLIPDWARATMILLYMRSTEGTLRFVRNRFGWMSTRLEGGERPDASMPEATELAHSIAEKAGGIAWSPFFEQLFNRPTTGHLLGGCCMGASRELGVIDHQHRVHGYNGLFVIDGSAISANVGVNPSLTICALAERAMTFIPPKQKTVRDSERGAQSQPTTNSPAF